MTISEAFEVAVQHHQAGRLAAAEALYRQILGVRPNHSEALRLLGVIAHQAGRHTLALEWIHQAIDLDPNNPVAHSNLGDAYRAAGCLNEAIAAYGRALALRADYPEVHIKLGVTLVEQGRFDEAIAAYRLALKVTPHRAEVHNNLGNALRETGRLDEAIAALQRARELKPDYPQAHNNLGAALAAKGRFEEAIGEYRCAIQLQPDYAEAHNNLGGALAAQGRLEEAAAACRRALQIKPDFVKAHTNLGIALAALGRREEAIAAYRSGFELQPVEPKACLDLGIAFARLGRIEEAIAACRRAIQLKSDYAEAHNNLGAALAEQGQLDNAVAAFRRSIELQPDCPDASHNLGTGLREQGRLDESIEVFRHALRLRPGHAATHSDLICSLHLQAGHSGRTIAEERQRWNRQFGEPLERFVLPHANERSVDRRLRVGYVSPHFRDHVVGRYMLPLLKRHDLRNFEILCYSGVEEPDKMTEEFRRRAQHWRNTAGIGDEALAEIIRRDGVDILVDLTQHLTGNRLPMFARKPAPVQVSFAGYPESTGLDAIEYRISDRYLDMGFETVRKERVYLIDSFYCYDPCGMEVEVNPLPCLESGTVTFGCLNSFCKVNERALSLWARVLGRVNGSRLMIASHAGAHRQRTLETLEREGVEARRVEFVEYRPRREYLELYHRLDIVLDPFPYNGGITSCEALWMGVPVVSLGGETAVSRAGLSLLTNLGLPELAACSEAGYVNIAGSLARNLPRLAELRATLRPRMLASPLMDAPRFARQVEQVYREMWRAWSQPPCAKES